MDSKEIVARALEYASVKENIQADGAAQQQIRDFRNRYPFKEKPELLRSIAPNDLYDSSADDRFFDWMERRTGMVGTLFGHHAAVFPEAVKRMDFFKVILTVLVSDKKSISFKIDQNWGVIPGFGGDKLIAKKLLALYYEESVMPVFRTEDLERFSYMLGIDYRNRAPQHFRKDYSLLSTGLKFELLNAGLMRFKSTHLDGWTNTMFAAFLNGVSPSRESRPETPAAVPKESTAEKQAEIAAQRELDEARLKEAEDALAEARESIGAREAKLKQLEEQLRLMEEEVKKGSERLQSTTAAQQETERKIEALARQLKEKEDRIKSLESELSRQPDEAGVREIDFAEAGIQMFEGTMPSEGTEERIKTGTQRLDDLLRGGFPVGSQMIVYGPSFIGKEIVMGAFAAQGLSEGIPLIWVTTDRTIDEIHEEMSHFAGNYGDYEKQGLVQYIDAYSRIVGDSTVSDNARYLEDSADIESISSLIEDALAAISDRVADKGYRLIFRSISSLSANFDIKNIFALLRPFVARIRKDAAVAIYSIERGIMSEQDLQIISTIMDGVMEFSTDGRNNFLSVQGICETQTRDKIQYTAGKNALNIGSFTLGRIK